ncbi:MAG TPA: hypothetical protein VI731_10270, partial [Bacteroidia bacterium]|nr:hypothetical protein [Bacteroidia bacterium]
MERIFSRLFTRRYFPERILFLAVAGGMLIDGWIGAVFKDWSAGAWMRILVSVLALIALGITCADNTTRQQVRRMAYAGILLLVVSAALLNVSKRFDYDNSLTFIGIYIICSLYFRSVRGLLTYLLFGFLVATIAIVAVDKTIIMADVFLFRFFLAGL